MTEGYERRDPGYGSGSSAYARLSGFDDEPVGGFFDRADDPEPPRGSAYPPTEPDARSTRTGRRRASDTDAAPARPSRAARRAEDDQAADAGPVSARGDDQPSGRGFLTRFRRGGEEARGSRESWHADGRPADLSRGAEGGPDVRAGARRGEPDRRPAADPLAPSDPRGEIDPRGGYAGQRPRGGTDGWRPDGDPHALGAPRDTGRRGAPGNRRPSADPRGDDPRGTDPRGAALLGADPLGAEPRGDLRGPGPRGVDPRDHDPLSADLRGADLRGDFRGADQRGDWRADPSDAWSTSPAGRPDSAGRPDHAGGRPDHAGRLDPVGQRPPADRYGWGDRDDDRRAADQRDPDLRGQAEHRTGDYDPRGQAARRGQDDRDDRRGPAGWPGQDEPGTSRPTRRGYLSEEAGHRDGYPSAENFDPGRRGGPAGGSQRRQPASEPPENFDPGRRGGYPPEKPDAARRGERPVDGPQPGRGPRRDLARRDEQYQDDRYPDERYANEEGPVEEREERAPEPAPRTSRAGRNVPVAIGVGAALVVVVLGSLFFAKPAFLAILIIAAGLGSWELVRAISRSGPQPPLVPLVAGGAVMIGLAWFSGLDALSLGLLISVLAAFVWRLGDGPAGYQRDMGASTLILVYVPFLIGFGAIMATPDDGKWRILCLLAAVVLSDTGGFAAGVFFGKHPMAPTISPKKSWEGFAGSLVATAIGSAISLALLLDVKPWWGALFGVVVSVACVLGDLVESLLKRDLGIKDMSNLLPGHGGLMDRLDSIVFALPTAYVLLSVLAPPA